MENIFQPTSKLKKKRLSIKHCVAETSNAKLAEVGTSTKKNKIGA